MNLAFTDEIGSGFKYWGEKKKKRYLFRILILRPGFKHLYLINILFPQYCMQSTNDRSRCYFNLLQGFKIWPYFDTITHNHVS